MSTALCFFSYFALYVLYYCIVFREWPEIPILNLYLFHLLRLLTTCKLNFFKRDLSLISIMILPRPMMTHPITLFFFPLSQPCGWNHSNTAWDFSGKWLIPHEGQFSSPTLPSKIDLPVTSLEKFGTKMLIRWYQNQVSQLWAPINKRF